MTTSTSTSASAVTDNGLAALSFSRGFFEKVLDEIPPDKMMFQPVPGGNHALWQVGHMAVTDDMFLSSLGGRPALCPEGWQKLFGYGSQPSGDPSDYPSPQDVRRTFDQARQDLRDWFSSMSREQLAEPLPKDLSMFAPSFGALMSSLACHEGMHIGQLTVIRKALGLAPAFG
jgi:uncharacterized damage-inducible protein DinB